MAAEMTDEEWVGRWGLQRGATVGVDDHLTMMLAEDESGTPILIPPPPDTVLTYNEPTPGAPAAPRTMACARSCVYVSTATAPAASLAYEAADTQSADTHPQPATCRSHLHRAR
jgi:hypothetical protein